MTALVDALRRIGSSLEASHARFALVGGLAVACWAEPRLTRHADLAVAVVDDAEAEALVRALVAHGHRAVTLVEQQDTARLATVRLVDDSDVLADLLFASSGIEPEIVEAAIVTEVVPDVVLPIARVGDLIAMRLLSRDDPRRPTDADDLGALRAVATADDWLRAQRTVDLIVRRGFARGRDLIAALDVLRRDGAD